ncbi:metal ABC transporter ATP-binding protein [Corynebacterium amycolatum]|uniref:Metal ABC transporter ATP-binding protein n=1 Tax=Corynebacterium amycolatum TaxID=43765 RepID=A0AB37GG09_CORAY|nr:metal ABC transporter ATP-binding protein [Corynebacterium amycolatum]MCQ9127243.1 metal ABC transporter ATP-binding protein [Corynebacterium amycolatum]MCQ9141447.1 metal ABC transporter ATP-binding protein [Corynebacterium amycolatum]QPR31092.1 metal ABC transporter ATP-binding protein [Corynebacterium amycolatum]QQB82969.1 metal ABC transporter ATP-binding protein [Corynebacterium amycolatum]QQV00538.1 metal ABC transporter ATP-binding protein [Corynebacterium amycolatum]
MPSLTFTDAAVEPLWSGLNLDIEPGEFLAILGPNGVGKSTLLTTALGMRRLTHGSVKVDGNLGYIPQQRMFEPSLPIRVRDLVELAAGKNRSATDQMLEFVGATGIADRRVGTLSGGQQQLVRQAQALVSAPDFLLCDEPLLSLDPAAQRTTVKRLDRHRRENDTAVVFVTHDINPILGVCDRVLYLTPHGHAVGSVEEIITSETLSELYQTKTVVARVEGKLVIA